MDVPEELLAIDLYPLLKSIRPLDLIAFRTVRLLEDFAVELSPIIQDLYNQSLKEGSIPSLFKSSIVTPIPKV